MAFGRQRCARGNTCHAEGGGSFNGVWRSVWVPQSDCDSRSSLDATHRDRQSDCDSQSKIIGLFCSQSKIIGLFWKCSTVDVIIVRSSDTVRHRVTHHHAIMCLSRHVTVVKCHGHATVTNFAGRNRIFNRKTVLESSKKALKRRFLRVRRQASTKTERRKRAQKSLKRA